MLLTRMLELLGRYLIVFIPLFAVLMIADKILKKRKVECFVTQMSFAKKTAALMFAVYMYILIYLTLCDNIYMRAGAGGINLIPFNEIHFPLSILDAYSLSANIMLFVPLGFFVYLFSKRPFVSLFASFLTSVAIEVIQIFIGRTCDIDDVICNTLGGLVGICLSLVLMKIIKLINQRITR